MFNFSPCGSPGSTVTAYPWPVPARGWPSPCPLRGLLCVPGGCTVRACSPGHAHSAHHFCVLFTAPRALGVCAACRVSSSASHPSRPALHILTRVRLAPTSWVCCAHALAEPSLAMQSRNHSPLPPPSLSCLQACVTTPPSL